MPPKRTREHHARQAQESTYSPLDQDVLAKRRKKHLDELERSNYSEPTLLNAGDGEDDAAGPSKGRARQIISDKRNLNIVGKKKKSTMSVRTALLYRKNLSMLIEEADLAHYPPSVPTYLTAVTPPPSTPPRMICSVCGYWGRYKCRRCAMPYCDRSCESVHDETRCERRVL
ncbi:hypothetical protein HGRIS_003608 [Hohenbuehelia grisea]|uniref:HIT-type domain-containing protein n=1 Tax=Hohenbuehelia grisea TaxID=104357 RepID=A0ABR3JG35_9AGAR